MSAAVHHGTETETLPPRRRNPRGSLSAEQIVEGAWELASGAGLEGFSMPQLARHLGVGVASVYWYFRSKDDLLAALADRASIEYYQGLDDDAGLEGEDLVLQHFRVIWRRLRENRLYQEVFISRFWHTVGLSPEATARAFGRHQRELALMVDAGLSPRQASEAYGVLSAYTRGHAMVADLQAADLPPEMDPTGASRGEESFDIGLRGLWRGLAGPTSPLGSGISHGDQVKLVAFDIGEGGP
jgi:AcrR family transcriptional regulator